MLQNSQVASCQIVPNANFDVGGPAYSVSSLAEQLGSQGVTSSLFTLHYPGLGALPQLRNCNMTVHHADQTAVSFRGLSANAHLQLRQLCSGLAQDSPLVIHNHGLWMFPNLYSRLTAKHLDCPYVISPRGMLESWSMKRSRFVKIPYWALFERKNLESATLFHATSFAEAASIRSLKLEQPIAVIPNGIDPPAQISAEKAIEFTDHFPQVAGKKVALFLSRIHPKKGLEMLIRCWKQLGAMADDWHLIIAGPDQIGYQSVLEKLIGQLQLENQISFTGVLSGPMKSAAYSTAQIFVLPSHSENFGIVVAEALTHQIPVVTTTATPWAALVSEQCGWICSPEEGELFSTLQKALQTPQNVIEEMGLRGQHYAIDNFSWEQIGAQMANVYSWLLGFGEKPGCIVM